MMIDFKVTYRPWGKLLFALHYFFGINFPIGWVVKIEVKP